MNHSRELEILFPTNYSDSCYRTIAAVAQLAAGLRVRITLLHAYNPRATTRRHAEDQLHSFFAEAAHYCDCRRVVAEGPALDAIKSHIARNPTSLLMVPESDRIGLPRLGHKSMRARLLKSVPVPLWTLGARVPHRSFARPIRNIACTMVYDAPNLLHIRLAAKLAERFNAQLHLVDVIPTVDESSMLTPLYSSRPLTPDSALSRIANLTTFMKHPPQVHISSGTDTAQLRKLLHHCDADVLFTGPGQAIRASLWGDALEKPLGRCGCPVIALDGAALDFPGWNLAHKAAQRPPSPATLPSTLDRGSHIAQA
ncbi:MAG: universal stress protein [Acidobacteriota bacterium]